MKILIITAFIVIGFLIFFWFLGGLRETLGDFLIRVFPKMPLKAGDKIEIFIDGRYNRAATIDEIMTDKVIIYKKLPLPVNYRGRFYAIGVDENNHKIVYVSNRRYMRFVRVAELIRRGFNVMDDEDMLPESRVEEIPEITEVTDEVEYSEDKQ